MYIIVLKSDIVCTKKIVDAAQRTTYTTKCVDKNVERKKRQKLVFIQHDHFQIQVLVQVPISRP